MLQQLHMVDVAAMRAIWSDFFAAMKVFLRSNIRSSSHQPTQGVSLEGHEAQQASVRDLLQHGHLLHHSTCAGHLKAASMSQPTVFGAMILSREQSCSHGPSPFVQLCCPVLTATSP